MIMDFVGGSSKPKTLTDVQTHFRSRGFGVQAKAVFDGELLVGILEDRDGYVFSTYKNPQFPQQINHAIAVAQEYGLPVIRDIRGKAY